LAQPAGRSTHATNDQLANEIRLHGGLVQISQLPYLDEHATAIAADVDDVWPVVVETLDRALSRAGMASYTRTVGCADCTASGPRLLAEGSTIPGFRVVAAVPASELVLEGRHRFSS
jgi:hypothetical protein